MFKRVVFVAYCRNNSYCRCVRVSLSFCRDGFYDKEFAGSESSLQLKKDCGNEKVLLKEDAVDQTLISSFPLFSSFSVGSLSINDFIKVNKVFNGFFIFL